MVFTDTFSQWLPVIKTHVQTALDAATTAKTIPTTAAVYGYNEWPEVLQIFPTALIGILEGSQTYSEGAHDIALHNAGIWLYLNPSPSMNVAMGIAPNLILRIRNEIAGDMNLGATVEHCYPPPPPAQFYQGPGLMRYAGKEFIGVLFKYEIKINETGKFTVAL